MLNIPLEFITYIHLIGFALGFGGALCSDVMFFSSIKDKYITKTEFRFMTLGGKIVWAGLLIMLISGLGLVFLKPSLLSSSKFLIKMCIVFVITVNGMFFHQYHLPRMKDAIDRPLRESLFFREKGHLLTISGAISVTSWFLATLLGSLPFLPFSFEVLFLAYMLLLVGASSIGYLMKRHLIRL